MKGPMGSEVGDTHLDPSGCIHPRCAELIAEIVVARLIGPFRIWDLEGFGRNPIRILKHLQALYASSYLYERVGPLVSASVNEPQ